MQMRVAFKGLLRHLVENKLLITSVDFPTALKVTEKHFGK